jgi:hypothetical protein
VLQILEGFESYEGLSGANLVDAVKSKWASNIESDWANIIEGHPRGSALQWLDTSSSGRLYFPINCTSKISFGFSFKQAGTGSSVPSTFLHIILGSNIQGYIRLGMDGCLYFYSASLRGVSSPIPIGTWVFLEFEITIDNSSGSCKIYMNGDSILDLSSIDTQVATTGQISSISIIPVENACFDNIYICDDSDGPPTRLGPLYIEELLPIADITTDWTPSTGTDHFAIVNSFNDSTYLTSMTMNNSDVFGFEDLTYIDSNIQGAMQLTRVGIDPLGLRELEYGCYSGANSNAGLVNLVSPIFESIIHTYTVDPNTSNAWTVTGINMATFGIKVTD